MGTWSSASVIETFLQPLPHGITLSCRAAGPVGRPVLMFLHGFPEAAFVWDPLLEHFSLPAHGAYRCIAPNLRGLEHSSAPPDVEAYHPKHLVQDIVALIALHTLPVDGQVGTRALAGLVAHDWGGAIAWNFANQQPGLAAKLVVINAPHPGTFLRELTHNAEQRAASAYMNFLIRPDAEELLAQDDFRRMWRFFYDAAGAAPDWLTQEVRKRYREVWQRGLSGGCNYYRASPLRPARDNDPAAAQVELPFRRLTVAVPTMVIWGMNDRALRPELVDGLDQYVPHLIVKPVTDASHWIVHEKQELVIKLLDEFLRVH